VWIDLQAGKEKLWSELDKQWRYGVRSAQRSGIQIEFAATPEDVSQFHKLCMALSQEKIFHFECSELFLQYLLDHSDNNDIEVKLFLVKIDSDIAAGAFIMRVGRNCHYMFGAVNRKYSKLRVGEFVQWSVIEWACEKNCIIYDLEGIDEIKNPGVANFKKKMGGEVINLPNPRIHSFNLRGKFLSKLIRNKLQ
jgi:lipid II:glycine glycyltransferase (peptidoglycan interpeptide bridge formation enzyme)